MLVFFVLFLQRHASAQHSSSSLLTLSHRQSPQDARPIRAVRADLAWRGHSLKTRNLPPTHRPARLPPARQLRKGLPRAEKTRKKHQQQQQASSRY